MGHRYGCCRDRYHPSPLVVEWHSHHGIGRRKDSQVRRISPLDKFIGKMPEDYAIAFRSIGILFRHATASLGIEASCKHMQFLQNFLQEQLEAHHD